MSDKYAALRAANHYRADGGDIGSGRIKEIADNVYGDEEKILLARCVLTLLAEREADKARIIELSQKCENDPLLHEIIDLKERIAELESRKVKLPENCEHDVIAPVMSFLYEGGYEFDREDYRAVVGRLRGEIETVLRRTLRADGITLETGE